MAMHQDGERSNSSPLLRQRLQPPSQRQPLSETEGDARIKIGQDHDDDDDDDGGGRGGDDNDDAVAENVVGIVDGMGLDENEAAALRLAIARGDANVRGALELFRWVCPAYFFFSFRICDAKRFGVENLYSFKEGWANLTEARVLDIGRPARLDGRTAGRSLYSIRTPSLRLQGRVVAFHQLVVLCVRLRSFLPRVRVSSFVLPFPRSELKQIFS